MGHFNRKQIETSFSLLTEQMGLQQLKSRTLEGFLLKIYTAVLALIFHITTKSNCKQLPKNSTDHPNESFGPRLRCSSVTEKDYAPSSRLAENQNLSLL